MSSDNETLGDQPSPELDKAAQAERDFMRNKLKRELGREPTEEELDDWLRQHTESY